MREMMLAPDREAGAERRRARLAEQLDEKRKKETKIRSLWRRVRPRFTRRDLLTFWGPLAAVCVLGVAAAYWSDLRDATIETAGEMRAAVIEHPEFAVRKVEITGRRETPQDFVLDALGLAETEPAVSSLEFNVAAARERLIGLPWIEDAAVALDPTGTLRLRIEERAPVAVWRAGGRYWLIDETGQPIAPTEGPGARLDLPYLLGAGANEANAEARALLLSAPENVAQEILALVRRGERRWDAVSAYGFVIKLPETDALEALRRYARSGLGPRLKSLAVVALDLRRPEEPPVLRLEPGTNDLRLDALAELRKPDPR